MTISRAYLQEVCGPDEDVVEEEIALCLDATPAMQFQYSTELHTVPHYQLKPPWHCGGGLPMGTRHDLGIGREGGIKWGFTDVNSKIILCIIKSSAILMYILLILLDQGN